MFFEQRTLLVSLWFHKFTGENVDANDDILFSSCL